jgi:hypothetical protein
LDRLPPDDLHQIDFIIFPISISAIAFFNRIKFPSMPVMREMGMILKGKLPFLPLFREANRLV